MPPKKTSIGGSDESSSRRATDNDLKFFESYLKNMKSVPDVSWDDVAADMGLAHGGSARERFRQIRQKLGWATVGAAGSAPRGKRKPVSGADGEGSIDCDQEQPATSPTKKRVGAVNTGGRWRKKTDEAVKMEVDGQYIKNQYGSGAPREGDNAQDIKQEDQMHGLV